MFFHQIKRILFGIGLGFITLMAPAQASQTEWSSTPMGCIPTTQTAAADNHVTRAGKVAFEEGKTGRIVLTCPVTEQLPEGRYVIEATVNRGFGGSVGPAPSPVDVRLRSASELTGAVEDILVADRVNLRCRTNYCRIGKHNPKEVDFDLENKVYWIAITLNRTDAGQSISVQSVSLIRTNN